jgi:hypothetical protein
MAKYIFMDFVGIADSNLLLFTHNAYKQLIIFHEIEMFGM